MTKKVSSIRETIPSPLIIIGLFHNALFPFLRQYIHIYI